VQNPVIGGVKGPGGMRNRSNPSGGGVADKPAVIKSSGGGNSMY
jgi:hypothetical protein